LNTNYLWKQNLGTFHDLLEISLCEPSCFCIWGSIIVPWFFRYRSIAICCVGGMLTRLMTWVNRFLLLKWQEQLFPFFKLSSQHLQIMSHHKCFTIQSWDSCTLFCDCLSLFSFCISHTQVAYKFHHFQQSYIWYIRED
jgi:hypothetical protein